MGGGGSAVGTLDQQRGILLFLRRDLVTQIFLRREKVLCVQREVLAQLDALRAYVYSREGARKRGPFHFR